MKQEPKNLTQEINYKEEIGYYRELGDPRRNASAPRTLVRDESSINSIPSNWTPIRAHGYEDDQELATRPSTNQEPETLTLEIEKKTRARARAHTHRARVCYRGPGGPGSGGAWRPPRR